METSKRIDLRSRRAKPVRFGNLVETMISLWSAVSGGNDWMYYGELLRRLDK